MDNSNFNECLRFMHFPNITCPKCKHPIKLQQDYNKKEKYIQCPHPFCTDIFPNPYFSEESISKERKENQNKKEVKKYGC